MASCTSQEWLSFSLWAVCLAAMATNTSRNRIKTSPHPLPGSKTQSNAQQGNVTFSITPEKKFKKRIGFVFFELFHFHTHFTSRESKAHEFHCCRGVEGWWRFPSLSLPSIHVGPSGTTGNPPRALMSQFPL